MDAIYTSAQLTLIAAAGSDPSYGLPGVSKARNSSFRYERVGSAIVAYHPPACGWSIAYSPWFFRAWTLQEGYLSRRRLYFTDSEISFVCNQSQHQDITSDAASGIDLLNGTVIKYNIDPRPSSLEHAIEMLEQYSVRKLSYDADALYAVTGILNHLSAAPEAVDSIWGVPFLETLPRDRPKLCIHWEHPEPTTRRQDFPSWSPLGWHGAVRFAKIRTQYTLSSDERAKIREIQSHQPRSKQLEIRARLFRFPIVHIIWPYPPHMTADPGEPNPHLVLPITDDTGATSASYNVFIPIQWDTSDLSSVETTSALCAITSYERVPKHSWKHFGIILLRPCAEHYERIGYAWYSLAKISKSLGNSRCGPDSRTIMPLDDNALYYWSPKGDHEVLWILDKEEETIVLG